MIAQTGTRRTHAVLATLVCLAAILGVLAVDYYQPAGLVLATLYVAVVVYAFVTLSLRTAVALTILCTVATGADLFRDRESILWGEETIERMLAAMAVWIVAVIMWRARGVRAALEQSEALFDQMVETSPDGFILTDDAGVILSANPAATAMFGYRGQDLVGQNIEVLIPEQSRAGHREAMSEYLAGGMDVDDVIGVTRDVQVVRRDGSAFPIEITVTSLRTESGRFFNAIMRDVSERRENEGRLRESQRTLSTLMSNLPGMAYRCLLDEHWTMRFASQGCAQLTGYEPHELVNGEPTTFAKMIFPEDRTHVTEEVQKAVRAGVPYQLSYRLVHRNGDIRWVWEQGQSVPGRLGTVHCLEGFITDVTKLKRIEQALRESEERFRSIADSTPLMIWATGLERTVTFANARVMEFTGLTLDELMGKGWINWTHPEDRESATRTYLDAFNRWEPFAAEYRARRHDGVWRWIEVHGAPRFAPGGEFVGYIGSASDVTDRHEALEALKESESRFRSMADCSPAIVWMSDPECRGSFFNRTWTELTGQSLEDACGEGGHGWRHFIYEEDFAKHRADIAQAVAAQHRFNLEYRVKCRDGTDRRFWGVAVPRVGSDGTLDGYTGLAVDITEARQAADELARAKRLETAGRLAGQIAHDFNNLLGPLVAYPEILQAKFSLDPAAQTMLRDMQNAALQIAEINQQLLTLGRRGHYNVEPLDLNALIATAVRTVELPPLVQLTVQPTSGALMVRGGSAQLMRVLVNLMSNAVEAMDEAGTLTVQTEDVYLDEPLRRYATVRRGEYAVVRITDTGAGIPAESLEHVFEPFFTTKRPDCRRGSGLGLSVVHSVMEDHEGYVDVESAPGRGSTFSLYFPILHGEAIANEIVSAIEPGAGEKLLVVDDDPVQRRIIQTSLERVGYRVTALDSGEEALRYLPTHPQDVVVLDMVMGAMDGTETLRRIREMYPSQRALILTGYSTSDRAQAALALGNCDLLAKPIQISTLTGAIRRALSEASRLPAGPEAP